MFTTNSTVIQLPLRAGTRRSSVAGDSDLRLPTDCDPETLHPYFRELLDRPARAPARAVIREIGPCLTPNDPDLVNEFQNKGFDQRLWEIYL
jgi:hypothetical protein